MYKTGVWGLGRGKGKIACIFFVWEFFSFHFFWEEGVWGSLFFRFFFPLHFRGPFSISYLELVLLFVLLCSALLCSVYVCVFLSLSCAVFLTPEIPPFFSFPI